MKSLAQGHTSSNFHPTCHRMRGKPPGSQPGVSDYLSLGCDPEGKNAIVPPLSLVLCGLEGVLPACLSVKHHVMNDSMIFNPATLGIKEGRCEFYEQVAGGINVVVRPPHTHTYQHPSSWSMCSGAV